MRILVLGGAGAMASGTVRDLISPHQEQITRVVVADRLLGPAQALVDSLGDPRLCAVTLAMIPDDKKVVRGGIAGDSPFHKVGERLRLSHIGTAKGQISVLWAGF